MFGLFLLSFLGINYNLINKLIINTTNTWTAERYARKFAALMQQGDIDAAHEMLTDESREENSIEDLTTFANTEAFQKYESLEVCLSFSGHSEDNRKYLDGKGDLYFDGEYLPFQIILRQDHNKNWKVQGFIIVPNPKQTLCVSE